MDLQKTIHRHFLKRECTEKCTDGADMQGYTYKKRKKNKHKEKSHIAEEMPGTDKERNYHPHSFSNESSFSNEWGESPSSNDITEAFDIVQKTQPLHIKDQNRKKERNTCLKKNSSQDHSQPFMSNHLRYFKQKWTSLDDADIAASELESFRIKENDKLSDTRFIPEDTKELRKHRRKNKTINKVDSSTSNIIDVSKEKRKRKKKKSRNRETIPASCATVKVEEKVSSKSITEASQSSPVRKKKKSSKNTHDSWGENSNQPIDDESILLGCDANFPGLDHSNVKIKLEAENGCKSSIVEIRNIESDLSRNETPSELSFQLHITSSESECSESTQNDYNVEDGILNVPEETTAEGVSQKAHKKKSLQDSKKNLHSPRKESIHKGNNQKLLIHKKKISQNPKPKSNSCENTSASVPLNTIESLEDENESELRLVENAKKSSQIRIDEEGLHYCTQCDIKFDSVRALMSHDCHTYRSIAPRPSGKERTLACILCGRMFVYNYHLKHHFNTIHRGKKKYKCEICDKLFSVKQTLVVHLRVHNKEKPYECEICDYKSITSTNLNRHYKVKHGMVQSHECRVCSYKFFSEGDLNLHLQQRHKSSTMQVLQSLV